MSVAREGDGNASKPNSADGDASEPSTPQSEKDPSSVRLQQELNHAKGNSFDDNDNDAASDIYERWSPVNQTKWFPMKEKTNPQATTTPPFSTPPMAPLAEAKSTLTVVKPPAVDSRRLCKRFGQTKGPIDTTMQQIQTETASPSHKGWPELSYNIVQTFLDVLRNPFFVPLCFVLALLYLISSFTASLTEIVDTLQSAMTAISSSVSFTWQHTGALMQSVWDTATPSLYQMMSTGADMTSDAMNKTTVAVCSHYFGWIILTNIGFNCSFSVSYQPLDDKIDVTFDNATLGLSQIANTAVELLPYGRQLTWAELWLRKSSYKILESDMIEKNALAEHCLNYTDEIGTIGEELTSLVSETAAHLDLQNFNLAYLQRQIEQDDPRPWWSRLFYPKQFYVRDKYLNFIGMADDDLGRLLGRVTYCLDLIRVCQNTSGKIQQILQMNRNSISEEVNDRGTLARWLRRNEDLTQRMTTIDNMDEYLSPVLDLLGSIINKVRHVRAELSTLSGVLSKGHVGSATPQLMVQLQIISSNVERIQHARDHLLEGREKEKARHKQQSKDKLLQYEPMASAQPQRLIREISQPVI